MDRALLVGINAYPGAPLAGCLNDVTDMATFLTSKSGFAADSIRLLTDSRATTQRPRNADCLARRIRRGGPNGRRDLPGGLRLDGDEHDLRPAIQAHLRGRPQRR